MIPKELTGMLWFKSQPFTSIFGFKMSAHKTAIKRKKLSVPMRKLLADGRIIGRCLDYGCGHGYDADTLGMEAYDPHFCPIDLLGKEYDTITCNYVLNVLPDPYDRKMVLENIRGLLAENGKAYISVRNDLKNLKGYTKIGTWQGEVVLYLPVLYRNSGFVTYLLEK